MKEKVLQLLSANPFHPFLIYISDGSSYRVEHPDRTSGRFAAAGQPRVGCSERGPL